MATKLPSEFYKSGITAADIIGYTKGSFLATIYFKGGRFTQIHGNKDNIGYHPNAESADFFGNVSDACVIKYKAEKGDAKKWPLLKKDIIAGNYTVGSGKGRLLELYSSKRHISRSCFVKVTDANEKKTLFKQLSGLTDTKTQKGNEWYYKST